MAVGGIAEDLTCRQASELVPASGRLRSSGGFGDTLTLDVRGAGYVYSPHTAINTLIDTLPAVPNVDLVCAPLGRGLTLYVNRWLRRATTAFWLRGSACEYVLSSISGLWPRMSAIARSSPTSPAALTMCVAAVWRRP